MNTAIIIVTHNMGVAAYMADRIMVMRQGRVVEYGKAEDVIYHPREDYTKCFWLLYRCWEVKRHEGIWRRNPPHGRYCQNL